MTSTGLQTSRSLVMAGVTLFGFSVPVRPSVCLCLCLSVGLSLSVANSVCSGEAEAEAVGRPTKAAEKKPRPGPPAASRAQRARARAPSPRGSPRCPPESKESFGKLHGFLLQSQKKCRKNLMRRLYRTRRLTKQLSTVGVSSSRALYIRVVNSCRVRGSGF